MKTLGQISCTASTKWGEDRGHAPSTGIRGHKCFCVMKLELEEVVCLRMEVNVVAIFIFS